MDQDRKTCDNCREKIPVATFPLHERRCAKYCTYCEDCQQTVPKDNWQDHIKECHTPVPCPDCHELVRPTEQDSHNDVCLEGFELCKFCQLDIRRKIISEHVEQCGSRTDSCPQCGVRVKFSAMDEHLIMKCGHLKAEPALSPEVLASLPGLDHVVPSDPVLDDSALAARLQREENERDRAFERDLNMARQLQEQFPSSATSVFTTHGASGSFTARTDTATSFFTSGSTSPTSFYTSGSTSPTTRRTVREEPLPYNNLPVYCPSTGHTASRNSDSVETDSALAARLQQEENERDRAFEHDLNLARRIQEDEDIHGKPSQGNGFPHNYNEFKPRRSTPGQGGFLTGPSLHSESDWTVRSNPHKADPVPSDLLPCQFCDGFFPAGKLTLHQNACSSGSHGSGGAKPCAFCGSQIPLSTYSVHETACDKNPASRDDDGDDEEGTITLIPCESCDQLFPFDKIHSHQVKCGIYGH